MAPAGYIAAVLATSSSEFMLHFCSSLIAAVPLIQQRAHWFVQCRHDMQRNLVGAGRDGLAHALQDKLLPALQVSSAAAMPTEVAWCASVLSMCFNLLASEAEPLTTGID